MQTIRQCQCKVGHLPHKALQGDILSPLFFILTLELIFRRHDNNADKGGIKIHRSKAHKAAKLQSFKGTLADRAVQVSKWEAQQDDRPQVNCEQELLDNVYKFKYLGALIAADAQQCFDIND